MSYEYEEINRAIIQQNGIDNNINRGNSLREIDEVYALAEKLPEYEAKAKAWDKLMFEIDEINDEATVKELPSKIIRAAKITALSMVIKEYESGESE